MLARPEPSTNTQIECQGDCGEAMAIALRSASHEREHLARRALRISRFIPLESTYICLTYRILSKNPHTWMS
jgi:hypothetical protein